MSVKNIKGDVSNLNIQVGKIEQSVADNKGNISSLTTTVSGINTTVKKQGESISNLDQKADKISQQVTSVKSELNSKIELTAGEITQKVDDVRADLSSEIKQTSDKISQTVTDMNNNLSTRIDQTAKDIELNASKTEEIGNSLNNLEIGGRNLLMNTRDFGGNKWILVGISTPPVYDTDGMYYIGVVDTWSNYAKQIINIDPGEYIISLYAKSSKQAVLEIKDDSSIHNHVIGNITVSSNTWEKYTLSFKNTYVTYPFMFTLLTRQNTSTIGGKFKVINILGVELLMLMLQKLYPMQQKPKTPQTLNEEYLLLLLNLLTKLGIYGYRERVAISCVVRLPKHQVRVILHLIGIKHRSIRMIPQQMA